MKKIIIISLIILILIGGVFTFIMLNKKSTNIPDDIISVAEKITISSFIDYPYYENITDLANKATDTILGEIIDVRIEEIKTTNIFLNISDETLNSNENYEDIPTIYTIFTVQINNAFKGKYDSGDTIEIKQLGGENDKYIHVTNAQLDLNNSDNYVFFLESYENAPAEFLNSIHSAYIWDTNNLVDSSLTPLQSVNDENELVLSYNDLLNFAVSNGKDDFLNENNN